MAAPVLRLPPWVRRERARISDSDELKKRLRRGRLVTVCEEARCPNIGECFSRGTATFMLLGDTCTRRCEFCSVATGRPPLADPLEPDRVAATAADLNLSYVVLTMVARDDLADEGAGQVAAAVRALHKRIDGVAVEVLTSDFNARTELIDQVLASRPEVFGHNIETVERLSREVRGRARYRRSLSVLSHAARVCEDTGFGAVKSGVMVGLGETRDEISELLRDVRETGCRLITIGQYLRPTREQRPVDRYVEPSEFDQMADEARTLGFDEVASGPLVRSSYRADQLYAASKV
ncbi:MAG: lipoic acid synthetase [Hyphomicrobiaceae bacterium]|jgi:lipoic acid synthetase